MDGNVICLTPHTITVRIVGMMQNCACIRMADVLDVYYSAFSLSDTLPASLSLSV